jgi:two-component system cell cycle response regulator
VILSLPSLELPRRKKRVLVVDDSATVRAAIARELAELEFEVVQAGTRAEAVSQALATRPDLMTLDISMPDGTGYEVCEELGLYEETMRMPIIMVSGRPSDRERMTAIGAGAVEYFVKPFQRGTLKEFVEDLFVRLEENADKTVYCLDESAPLRAMFQRLLSGQGYRCTTFGTTDELAAAMRMAPCELLLLDLGFGNGAGLDFLYAVRRQSTFDLLPIIALTGAGARKHLPIAFRAGANDFLRKPFFAEELLARVDAQLHLRTFKQRMKRDASIDVLTSLYNRGELERLATMEVERACREQTPTGILVVDIDHFKRVNDRLGHPVGDAVLREVAARIGRVVRAMDIVGRYGGEEFVALVPNINPAGIEALAERIRTEIASTPVATSLGAVAVTASVGAHIWQHSELRSRAGLEALVEHADEALFESKRRGRNVATLHRRHDRAA